MEWNSDEQVRIWTEPSEQNRICMLISGEEASKMGFPAGTDKALITCLFDTSAAIDQFALANTLTPTENKMLTAFTQSLDVRKAASMIGVTYESARKYLKAIFSKSKVNSQTELMKKLLFSPAILLAATAEIVQESLSVRRLFKRNDGLTVEYFTLGPEDGHPVVFFDALAGSAIDVLGHPERYLPVLEELGMRLITICRPGRFRTSYRPLKSIKEYAEDVAGLCEHLGLEKVSFLSYSYGSNVALAVAHELPDLVDRITMSSVSYLAYNHKNWREMDLFFQITNVIGRRWPALLNRLLPFLARSITQNIEHFVNRTAERAKCDHDRAILQDQGVLNSARAMLMERTLNGVSGMVDECRIYAQPYGFSVADITAPMILLHGEFDINSPLGGAQLLAKEAPNATLHVLPGMGHHHIVVEWDWIFAAAMGKSFTVPEPVRRGHPVPKLPE